eukprot:TRINITY_DN3076_c0_g1_i1.p1 TRINITY_DN3076_c0_g1~~TRINITY_DN3076_c0_g1_i1.p1  ORF type:complete len:118 (-),score=9.52 TRINITY_DN3076_c0_g1_i1:70-423(-)
MSKHYSSKQTNYVDREIWVNAPCASQSPENKPNGKSCQKFYFKKPWEPKHALGKLHSKRKSFESRPGIATIDWFSGSGTFGCFNINGSPNSVNELMVEIGRWLDECQRMYNENENLY